MSVKYGKFVMPDSIEVDENTATSTYAKFIAEPFEPGFGHSIGNFLRRVLLTSLESPAIVSVSFEGVSHEYTAIDGIIEDMTDIVLNIKGALLRKLPVDEQDNSRSIRVIPTQLEITQSDLDKNGGQVQVKLGDLIKIGNFEVVNPHLHLFTVTKPMKKEIDFKVGFGRGYVPSERNSLAEPNLSEIVLDASFSPVTLVNYFVENTRVGQDTDFNKLILEVKTDGRITPVEALTFAYQIGLKHFEVFEHIKSDNIIFEEFGDETDSGYDELMEKLSKEIDEIELSVRSTNCLRGAAIRTIGELVTISERKMLDFRNFGKKSLNEIKAKLYDMGLSLGMNLSKYGITHDNVKDKIEQYKIEKSKETPLEGNV
ncbi:MAG: DNA-directed RNA polymerase subunit alpha [Chlamydiales bacterium]